MQIQTFSRLSQHLAKRTNREYSGTSETTRENSPSKRTIFQALMAEFQKNRMIHFREKQQISRKAREFDNAFRDI
jgi:hypothetical protein